MRRNEIPDAEHERRVIYVVDQPKLDELEMSGSRAELFQNPAITLILDSELLSMSQTSEIARRLVRLNVDFRDQWLVQNPHDVDSYFDKSQTLVEAARLKMIYLGDLAHILGAKSISISVKSEKLDKKDSKLKSSATVGLLGAEIDSQLSSAKKLIESYSQSFTSEGGSPDVERARDFLREKYLDMEPDFGSLIEKRSSQNTLTRVTIHTSLTNSVVSNFMLAVSAGGPLRNAKATLTSEKIEFFDLKVEISLEFPAPTDLPK